MCPAPTPSAGVGAAERGRPRGHGPPGALWPEGGPALDVSEEEPAEFPQRRQGCSGGEEAKNRAEMALKKGQVHFLWGRHRLRQRGRQTAGRRGHTCITVARPDLDEDGFSCGLGLFMPTCTFKKRHTLSVTTCLIFLPKYRTD